MKTFAEYSNLADEMWANGKSQDAQQNYLNAIWVHKDDDPAIDFEFYLRLAECYTDIIRLGYAKNCYERIVEMIDGDELTTALVFLERAKMWKAFNRHTESLFDLRSAKKHLAQVDDPELADLKDMLAQEVVQQASVSCATLYGPVEEWPPEPALALT